MPGGGSLSNRCKNDLHDRPGGGTCADFGGDHHTTCTGPPRLSAPDHLTPHPHLLGDLCPKTNGVSTRDYYGIPTVLL